MRKQNTIMSRIGSLVFFIVVICILILLYTVYKTYFFNGFIKAEYNLGISRMIRDKNVRFSKEYSYKIQSDEFNGAILYKELKVKPNTPYKVKCMVKTENVQTKSNITDAGANICILESTETSKSITGSSDWQELEFIFNSKNRNSVDIGFRLGGNRDDAKGTAWFSDFIVEEGFKNFDTTWNVACFIFKEIDVEVQKNNIQENLQLKMSQTDINTIKDNMNRFKNSCRILSNNKINIEYDTYEIDRPITSISYSETYGYYVDPLDVKEIIDPDINNKEYDHIFVAVRLGDLDKNIEIPVYDWIGLGGMDLYDIGFSNIRLPNNKNNYIYTYSPGINLFPEEVLVHEFLHSLERIMLENGYDIPEVHDNEKYGYKEEQLIGLKNWYKDYMTKNISDKTTNINIGLDPIVYSLKPAHESEFKYPIEIEFNREPKNVIEEIKNVFNVIIDTLKRAEKNKSGKYKYLK